MSGHKSNRPTGYKFSGTAVTLLLIALTLVGPASALGPQAGTVRGDKTVSPTDIQCDGSATVTLTLEGEAGVAGDPVDIALVLDRSGSMSGGPLQDLQNAARDFVDIMDLETDGSLDGTIGPSGSPSRIGVVSFENSASTDQGLTTDAAAVKLAINGLSAGGGTNHQAAFLEARDMLDDNGLSGSDIVIIVTDGESSAGQDGITEASNLRAAGVEIFAIGFGTVDGSQLDAWATDPDNEHVFIDPGSEDLDDVFEIIGAVIVSPAATDIEVVDTVDDHFSVSSAVASKGSVSVAGNVLTWTIDELGTETVTLVYTVTHDNTLPGGVEAVNDSVTYSDAEGKDVSFPEPSVNVSGCGADLEITKTDFPDPVTAGNNLTYTIVVTNNGPATATGVMFTDTLPANVDFDSATSPDGVCAETAPGSGTVTCDLGNLSAGDTAQVTIVVTVPPETADGAILTNTAMVTGNEDDPDPSNDTQMEETDVIRQADLEVTKSDSPDPVTAGGNLTYELVVTNNGPSDATGVTVTDNLPADVTFDSASTGCTYDLMSHTVTCDLGDLGASDTAMVTIMARVDPLIVQGASLVNTAEVAGNEDDPDSSNDTATTATTVPCRVVAYPFTPGYLVINPDNWELVSDDLYRATGVPDADNRYHFTGCAVTGHYAAGGYGRLSWHYGAVGSSSLIEGPVSRLSPGALAIDGVNANTNKRTYLSGYIEMAPAFDPMAGCASVRMNFGHGYSDFEITLLLGLGCP